VATKILRDDLLSVAITTMEVFVKIDLPLPTNEEATNTPGQKPARMVGTKKVQQEKTCLVQSVESRHNNPSLST
jgi:hypothetical protein